MHHCVAMQEALRDLLYDAMVQDFGGNVNVQIHVCLTLLARMRPFQCASDNDLS